MPTGLVAIHLRAIPPGVSVAFLLDAPTIALEAEGDGGALTTQHPIARLGAYKDKRYGEFAITRADYTSWVRNLREMQNGRIPIDYDHAPEAGGSTEAAGWITGLQLQTGAQIGLVGVDETAEYALATIEWTPQGAEAVRSKRWMFVSPTFSDTASNEEGEATGPYLHGVALTNRPFLRRGMPAISLSTEAGLSEMPRAVPIGSDTPAVPEIKTLRAALKLADTVSDDDVIAAAVKLAEAPPEPTPTPDTRTLMQLAEAEGKTLLSTDEVTALRATADQGAEALKQLNASRFDAAFAKAKAAGQVDAKPETRARLLKVYESDPGLAIELMENLPVVVKLTTTGAETGDAAAPEGMDADRFALSERAKAISAEKNITYSEALPLALREGN